MDKFKMDMLCKIENGIPLAEKELKRLVYFYEMENIVAAEDNTKQEIISIILLHHKFYAIEWTSNLTGSKKNIFSKQPYEVEFNANSVKRWQFLNTEERKIN